MSIFSQCALTRQAHNLITKAQAGKCTIQFTRAAVGDGVWSKSEDLQEATALKNICREYGFSDVQITADNAANIMLEVIIHNVGLTALFYVMEMGIYAMDPDLGEILYAILAANNKYIYLPAENGVGLSQIVERVNLEVSNASDVTVETTGALVSATDFLTAKELLETVSGALEGGAVGQIIRKQGTENYCMGWEDEKTPVYVTTLAEFPEAGEANVLYIDSESMEFYLWINSAYKKLPVGSEASAALQSQITANEKAIAALKESAASEHQDMCAVETVAFPAAGWSMASDGAYAQTVTASWISADDTPVPFLVDDSSTESESKAKRKAYGYVTYFESGSETIKAVCKYQQPAIDLTIGFKGV